MGFSSCRRSPRSGMPPVTARDGSGWMPSPPTASRHYQVGAVAIAPGLWGRFGSSWIPMPASPAADITRLRPEQGDPGTPV